MKQKIMEAILTSKNFSCFAPLTKYLVSMGLFNVWKGVYTSWEEAPGDDDVFEGEVWINKVTDRAQKLL